ncbi:T9SS type A sorting domain-containing protein [candidate division KSB1 bacterium]|nr:T9SS type A sorting domain-containing protein [candidate division KSB1 bacterium]
MRINVFWRFLILYVLLLVWPAGAVVLTESFDYPEGDLAGQGDATGGWGGAWEQAERGVVQVFAEFLNFGKITERGGILEVSEGGTTYRNLAELWADDGSVYWISMLYIRIDDIDVNDSYNGLSLFRGSTELLYIGKPWATRNLGLDGTGVGIDSSSGFDAYDGAWLVTKLVMTGDKTNDLAYLWIDPDPNVEPDTVDAAARVQWRGSNGFNRIRIGSGNPPDQAESFYDEIRIADTYAELTTTVKTAESTVAPQHHALFTNFPNPFNPATTISFVLAKSDYVNLDVFNIQGEKIKTLVSGVLPAGEHAVMWNGTDEFTNPAASGVYFCRLRSGSSTESRKMMLLK